MDEWPICGRCGEVACPPVFVKGEALCSDCVESPETGTPLTSDQDPGPRPWVGQIMTHLPQKESPEDVGQPEEPVEEPDNQQPESTEVATVGTNDFEAALKRIHEEAGTKTQVQLAELLGIRQSSISDAKRRVSIPSDWLLKLFLAKGVNPDWVLNGEPAMRYLAPVQEAGQAAVSVEALHARIKAEMEKPRTRDVIFDEFQEAWPTAQITFPPKAAGA